MGKKSRKAHDATAQQARKADVAPVLDVIHRAFDGVSPPDREHRTLFQAEAWDSYERVDQSKDHLGKWQDLPDAHIDKCRYALSHLDEQGIHFYLPALMGYFLRSTKSHGLLFTLVPSTGELKAYQRKRFKLFTLEQRKAILAFLEFAGESSVEPWRRVVECGENPDWFRKFY